MLKRTILLCLSCIYLASPLNAQALQKGHHVFRNGDIVSFTKLDSLPSLDKNELGFWDLSQQELTNKTSRHRYKSTNDSLPIIGAVEYGTRYYFPQGNDTLRLLAYENNLMRLDYDLPEVRMQLPVSVGDSLYGLFHSTGVYCDKLRLRSCGSYKVVADEIGKFVCLNGDTLRHVIRLHTTRITAQEHFLMDHIPSGIEEFTTDSILSLLQTDNTLLREDIYRWYAPGYRYPILESFTESYDPENAGTQHVSWYCSPKEQRMLALDVDNLAEREYQEQYARTAPSYEHSDSTSEENGDATIRYHVDNQKENHILHISYSLAADAQLDFTLSNIMGMVYQTISRNEAAGTNSSIDINYSNLPRGQYVVYIRCNQTTFTEKFTKL